MCKREAEIKERDAEISAKKLALKKKEEELAAMEREIEEQEREMIIKYGNEYNTNLTKGMLDPIRTSYDKQ